MNRISSSMTQDSRLRIPCRGSGIVTGVVISLLVLLLSSTAYAHKVSIYAYAEEGMVFAEGYFADGSRSRNSLVEVFNAETGEKLLEGRTDNEGKFSFKIPGAHPLKLVLHASMGHQNDYTLDEEEVKEAMGIEEAAVEDGDGGLRVTEPTAAPVASPGLSGTEIEEIVSRAMDRKLRPLTRMLVKLQENSERPGITEILGGIGYILGLMGIVMYFKSRR